MFWMILVPFWYMLGKPSSLHPWKWTIFQAISHRLLEIYRRQDDWVHKPVYQSVNILIWALQYFYSLTQCRTFSKAGVVTNKRWIVHFEWFPTISLSGNTLSVKYVTGHKSLNFSKISPWTSLESEEFKE